MLPFTVSEEIGPVPEDAGSIAISPFDPEAALMVNERRLPLKLMEPKVELLRPSSHVSNWRDVITGAPWALAAFTAATAVGVFQVASV